jgi:adenylate kinase family enzyme
MVQGRRRVPSPRRIVVVGVSGNGKTTLSRRLGLRLGLPVTELDALVHQPGWTEASDDDFRRDVKAAMSGAPDGWVLDGLYQRKIGDLILRRADTLVWLDQPLALVLRRLVKRAVNDIVTKRDLFNGNRQTWRFAFFTRDSLVGFAIKQHFKLRRNWPAGLGDHPNLQIVRLRSPREVEAWLEAQAPD